jgi:hypothetical protein
MAVKFYKKFEPNMGVNIGGTQVVKFPTLDSIIGYYSTQDENLQRIFSDHINNNRFGLSEIPWSEFEDAYIKKKAVAQPLRRPWRDELANQGSRNGSTISPEAKNAVAVVSQKANGYAERATVMADDVPSDQAVKAVAAVAEALKVPFTPNVGRREPR